MKIFKGVVIWRIFTKRWRHKENPKISSFKKVQTCIKKFFFLNNDLNLIISKAEKDLICVNTFIALPLHIVRNAYCLTARKQLSDISVLYQTAMLP